MFSGLEEDVALSVGLWLFELQQPRFPIILNGSKIALQNETVPRRQLCTEAPLILSIDWTRQWLII